MPAYAGMSAGRVFSIFLSRDRSDMAARPTLADFRFSDGLCPPIRWTTRHKQGQFCPSSVRRGKVRTVGFQQYKCRRLRRQTGKGAGYQKPLGRAEIRPNSINRANLKGGQECPPYDGLPSVKGRLKFLFERALNPSSKPPNEPCSDRTVP